MLAGLPTSFSDEREPIVYEMAICLSNSRWVLERALRSAVKALGHVGITDVITLMGYYTSVSMTLRFLRRAGRCTGPGSLTEELPMTVRELRPLREGAWHSGYRPRSVEAARPRDFRLDRACVSRSTRCWSFRDQDLGPANSRRSGAVSGAPKIHSLVDLPPRRISRGVVADQRRQGRQHRLVRRQARD